ncbi:n-acetyltransferase ESCO1 [Trichonephila inaurata madagascariensis]|uniref:N-acetyltransferase ESCO1 n=1 Tax=Trichonephila inaurata madagascariensis TaxID=2747483 RepID=A0A8X7BYR9_9ARAC|nr:n-acetyltransferase ESCO1 [Trichonephila inaurata madagascariensis]
MAVLNEYNEEFHKDNFYNPIGLSGYLTPLQRKKLREKRNIKLSTFVEKEPNSLRKITKEKGIKKAKDRRIPKLKVKTKGIKKILISKHSKVGAHLECSISELVQHRKDESMKEKRFFKSRSPQHLKKAKFVMPLTYKKNLLDFGSEKFFSSPTNLLAVKNVAEKISVNKALTSLESLTNGENDMQVNTYEKNDTSDDSLGINSKNIETSNLESNSIVEKQILADISEKVKNTECKVASNSNSEVIPDIFDFNWPSDEELLERQHRARAKFRESLQLKYNAKLKDSKEVTSDSEQLSSPKYYPIFNINQRCNQQEYNQSKSKKAALSIMDTSKAGEQLIIDAGQKEIGAKMCKTCGMIYFIGQEEDEKLHSGYHQTFLINLRFPGWKKECVVGLFDDGRIIQVTETDKNFKLKKIQDILFIVNRDLGFPNAGLPVRPNVMFLLFISVDKKVGGCLVAESIDSACQVISEETSEEKKSDRKVIWNLGSWYASSESVPAICGINRIWVSRELRRCKVASRLVDCLRQNFLFGHVVELHELAFTDPSPDGREFAAAYTGTDNFLVYK